MEKKTLFPLVDLELETPRLLALLTLSTMQIGKSKKKVKSIKCHINPVNSKWYALEAKTNSRFEEDVLLGSVYFQYYIRRGFTYLVDKETKDLIESFANSDIDQWENLTEKLSHFKQSAVRKGFSKFYDIKPEHLTAVKMQINNGEGKYTFSPILHNIKDGISIIKTRKANGSNAQITYSKELAKWVISSKNIAAFINSPAEIDPNDNSKEFCTRIAETWFKIIQPLNTTQLDELKDILDQNTFICEYVGPNEQHLVKYSESTLLFYCIANKTALSPFNDPTSSFAIFQKYGLPIVKYDNLGIFTDWEPLRKMLIDLSIAVCESPIKNEEEGIVLYMSNATLKVGLSMGKIKTLEYRIYRKLREHIKRIVKKKDANIYKAFIENYKKMVHSIMDVLYKEKGLKTELHLPHPFEYYDLVGEKVFATIDKMGDEKLNVTGKYVEFLEKIHTEIDMGKKEEAKK